MAGRRSMKCYDIARGDGAILGRHAGPVKIAVCSGREVVSMNLWILPGDDDRPACRVSQSVRGRARCDDPEAELPLPEAIADLVARGSARVRVLESPGPWFGSDPPAGSFRRHHRTADPCRSGRVPEDVVGIARRLVARRKRLGTRSLAAGRDHGTNRQNWSGALPTRRSFGR